MRTTVTPYGAGLENNLGAVVKVTNGGKPSTATKKDRRLKENRVGGKASRSGGIKKIGAK